MKVVLIYPPSDSRTDECFLIPNLALPVLAAFLRRRGVQTEMADLEIFYHKDLRGRDGRLDPALLNSSARVRAHLRGRLSGRLAEKYRALETALFEIQPLPKADLYGISLVNISTAFPLNAAALLAKRIKEVYPGAKVVIGSEALSAGTYRTLLVDYPVFDFAALGDGEWPLLGLCKYLGGKGSRGLLNTLSRGKAWRVTSAGGGLGPPGARAPRPLYGTDYKGYPLKAYELDGRSILARYDARHPVFDLLRAKRGGGRQLIAFTRFQTTCKGNCAFCGASPDEPNNRLPVARVLDELECLKDGGVTGVYFLNSNFNDDLRFAEWLCDGLVRRKLGLQWCDCVNFRAMNRDLLLKMKAAGAVKLTFGLETASDRLLRYVRKGITRERASDLLKFSDSIGLWNHIELIGGMPTETEQDIRETTEFIDEHAPVIDQYSLNSFYINRTATMALDPAKFGIRLRPFKAPPAEAAEMDIRGINVTGFDEIGGLRWEDKIPQIEGSTLALSRAIRGTGPVSLVDNSHIHLLMYLYRVFGHGRKPAIRTLMRACARRYKPYHKDNFVFAPPGSYLTWSTRTYRRGLKRSWYPSK